MNTNNRWYLAGIVGSLTLLAVAYFYFQIELQLVPCPLCMFQRAALVGVIIFCVLALLHRPQRLGQNVYKSGILLSLIAGIGIAGRQVWLQHLPPEDVPECGIDPIYQWSESIGDNFGFFDMIATTLRGSGDCAAVHWTFLNMGIAMWMLIIFSSMALAVVYSMIKTLR